MSKKDPNNKQIDTASSQNSIEDRIRYLDELIEWFYSNDFNLDHAIPRYKQVAELANSIQKDLEQFKNEVKIIADFTKA